MTSIIHLSDLHFRLNWEEDQGLVLEAFFKDLSKQLEHLNKKDVFLAFSGDVVRAGSELELYNAFLMQFDTELNKLGIPKSQRICIPGNHDVSVNFISSNPVEHEAVVTMKLDEKMFNDYIQKEPKLLLGKFDNYRAFEPEFADYGITDKALSGKGWTINEGVGVYCLNTAICSSGGFRNIDDKGRLAIDTRSLQKWLLECKAPTKVLVMHHPINWLTDWAQIEIKKILKNNFSLCLSGHVHDQSFFHNINKDIQLVSCSAPPLLTNKKDNLGYSIISVTEIGVMEITYRQWTKNNRFVSGVNFSDTDDGKVLIHEDGKKKEHDDRQSVQSEYIEKYLTNRLNEALRSFSSQPIIWAEPVLSKSNKISRTRSQGDDDSLILVNELISRRWSKAG